MKVRCAELVRALLFGAACGLFAACGTHGKPTAHDGAAGHDGGKDAPADGGSADADASEGGASPDASDGASDAGEARAEIDAGSGCMPPAVQTALSPAAEGLPVDGLVMWVRGDRGVYKTAQNEVCAWRDQSGPNRLLVPSVSRPGWESAGLGGQAAIHFITEGQDLYTDTLGLSPTSARTFIAVSRLVNTAGRFHPILQGQSGTAGNYFGIDGRLLFQQLS